MKKKILTLMAVSACALCCASALVACGGGDDNNGGPPVKPHTAAQWTAAFDTEIGTQYYYWQESAYAPDATGGGSYSLLSEWKCDAANRAYCLEMKVHDSMTADYYFQKGTRYYTSRDPAQGNYILDRMTPEDFATKEQNYANPRKKVVEDVLKQFRDDYGSFDYKDSGTVFYSDDNNIAYSKYEKNDVTITVQGTLANGQTGNITYNVEKVEASITEDNKLYWLVLTGVTGDGIDSGKLEFQYQPYLFYSGGDLREYIGNITLPELAGNKFGLINIGVEVVGVPEDEMSGYSEYAQWANGVLSDNNGKRITCVADGTITGDIDLDGIALSAFTWEEDDENYGDMTVTDGTYTLAGKYGMFDGNLLEIHLTNTIKSSDDKDVVFTYIFFRMD